MAKINARTVARALCRANPFAGQQHNVLKRQTLKERTENLLREGPHGAYVVNGDPNGWGGGNDKVLVTIYMEPKGDKNDCAVPLDYYGNGFEISCAASDLLGNAYIEFINAAVACVYPL